ncbi:MAG TPA: hypothetical protein VKR30_11580 [Candidatus Limnocylindrales bacterium]|nr:hypothetical protein [Candidatus Limnocylindrales bacterium]
MVEYGTGISHGPAGQVAGSGSNPAGGHVGSIDVGSSLSGLVNSASTAFSAMPLVEQVVIVVAVVFVLGFILRKVF